MVRLVFVAVLITAAVVFGATRKPYYDINDASALFEKYVRDYHKVYKNEADRAEHYAAFVNTLKVINKANAENSATFDLNQFADYTPEEQKWLHGLLPLNQ
ncbi:unnamed protein product [Leptosia nina]|uniref:Cathepsin propeptide inhibitor domain-containing protein n=1 Tax=Leptosia nina TaxID=320188 RepID=A0AAV1JDN5_9NEOP